MKVKKIAFFVWLGALLFLLPLVEVSAVETNGNVNYYDDSSHTSSSTKESSTVSSTSESIVFSETTAKPLNTNQKPKKITEGGLVKLSDSGNRLFVIFGSVFIIIVVIYYLKKRKER